jgi:trehalose 6-phosphate phosphatase
MVSGSASPGRRHTPPAPQVAVHPATHAFFLDVDGTLLDLAPSPDAVVVDPALLDLLRALVARTHGAVAFVSGRSIAALDDLFKPLLLPTAGLHGFERRNAAGAYSRRALPSGDALTHARVMLREFADQTPGVLLEDKQFALAVHYRQVPQVERAVLAQVEEVARSIGSTLEIQYGRMVAELRPANASKATAIADFMREPPFAGRRPVCLGDDLTDECAFEWVNAAGGLSIAVGVSRATAATAQLASVAEARHWLSGVVDLS